MTAIVVVLVLAGGFFLLVSVIGVLRLPDFYSRAHAAGKSETLGAILVLVGLALHNGWDLSSLKLILVLFLVAATNPTGVHALTRAALRSGMPFWIRQSGGRAGATGTPAAGERERP